MAYGSSKIGAYEPIKRKTNTKNTKNDGGLLGGAGYLAGSAIAGLAGGAEGIIDLGTALVSDLTGNHDYAEYVFKDNVVGDWHEDLTEDFNPGTGWKFAGDVAHGLGQSSWFLLSLIPGAQWLGPTVFGAGMVGQGISSAAEITGDVGAKEVAYGVTTAAVETGLETLMGGTAGAVKSVVKSGAKSLGKEAVQSLAKTAVRKGLAKQILTSAASEFAEEFASELIDTTLQRGYQIDPNKEYSLKDALYAGLVGMASGTISATPGSVSNAVVNQQRGAKIIKNGNSQTLVNTATKVADQLAASGTDFKNAPEWIKTLRSEVDAYNALVKKGQSESLSAQTILGEMQASLYFAETQAQAHGVQKSIMNADEADRAAWAEYINQSFDKSQRKKDYTAEDIANNTDDIAKQLAVLKYVKIFDVDGAVADMAQESAIEGVIEKERSDATKRAAARSVQSAENAAPVNEVGEVKHDLADDVADIESSATEVDDNIERIRGDVKKAVSGIKVDGKLYELSDKHVNNIANGVQKYIRQGMSESDAIAEAVQTRLVDIKSMGDEGRVKHELGKATLQKVRGAVINAYRGGMQNASVNDAAKTSQEAKKVAEGTEGQKSAENVTKGKDDGKAAEKSSERKEKSSESKKSEAKSGEPKINEAKESLTDEQRKEKARKRAEQMIEYEKANAPTAKELNTAREYVKGFDNLSQARKAAIVRMMRSADGKVDKKILKGVANLLAIIPKADIEIRFAEGIGNGGLYTHAGGKALIILDSSANYKSTIQGTIAHELVHYLENKAGYKEFSKYVMKRVKPERRAEVEARYNKHYTDVYTAEAKEQGLDVEGVKKYVADKMATEEYKALIESEVVAKYVGQALNNEKLLKKYADKDKKFIAKVGEWLLKKATYLRKKKDADGKADIDEELVKIADDMAFRVSVLLQETRTAGESTGETKYAVNANYDFTKSFADQIDDYKRGIIPESDALWLGGTPELYQKIGFNALPMTINQVHVDYALNGTKDIDHFLGKALLKQLPEKIKEPVAVFVSQTQGSTSVVSLLNFKVNGKQVIASIVIDGHGRQNSIRFDTNAITSVFGKNNALSKLLYDAIIDDNNGNFSLLYINKKEALSLLQGAGLQLPSGLMPRDGFIHSIREKASPVKPKFENVTESQQFKRWFGDWEKHPNTASKVVNADGTPKILYHQTGEDFTVFDPRKKGAGTNDDETPFGIFMKPADNDIGLKGKKQMALYARIVKPLVVSDRADLVWKLKKMSSKYAELVNQRNALSVEYKTKLENAAKAWGDYAKEYRLSHPDATRSEIYNDAEFRKLYDAEDILTEEWIEKADALSLQMKDEITRTLKDNDYDGVILKNDAGSGGRTVETYIALDPTQVKSATDNIGTFDKSNPDIRYDLADETPAPKKKAKTKAEVIAENRELKAENKELKASQNKMRGMLEKLAREEAEYQKRANAEVFDKKDVDLAVSSIESWTREEALSLAGGFELKGMTRARREDMISQIYIALHEQSARGQSGPGSIAVKTLAARIAAEYIDSAAIVGADGKVYHFNDIYDEVAINSIKLELTDLLYGEFSNMGKTTALGEFVNRIRVQREKFRQERFGDEKLAKFAREVSYQGMELRDIAAHQHREGTAEGLGDVTEKLAAVVDPKGNIRVGVIDKAMKSAAEFLEGEAGKLESEQNRKKMAEEDPTEMDKVDAIINENLRFQVDEFIRLRKGREGKALTAQEMQLAGDILRNMKTTIERYNKEFINGHWTNIDEAAGDGVKNLVSLIKMEQGKEYKTKIGEWLGSKVGKKANEFYFYKILSPETVIGALEGYGKGGILQSMYHSIREAQSKSNTMATRMLKPFDEFLHDKENRWEGTGADAEGGVKGWKYSYRDKLNVKKVSVFGTDITLGEAINLYMLTKREEAHAGLRESGYIVFDEDGHSRRIKIEDVDRARDFIANQFDEVDRKFLKMAEDFFNVTASKIKYDADMKIFGYSNNGKGYYVPMVRDRYSRMKGVTDARFSIGETVTLYSPSFTKNLVANANGLEGTNIMLLIDRHARGLADYSELYLPLKAFDRVYNRAVNGENGVTSIRKELNTGIWGGTERYFKDLFKDIQHQNDVRDNVVDEIVGKLRSAWVNSVLGANVKVVVTQTTSLGAATQMIEPRFITQASAVIGTPKVAELRERAYKYSNVIEARAFDMGALKAQGNVDKISRIGELSGSAIGWMDERVTLAIFHAAELKVEAQGGAAVGTDENARAAAKIADETIYATQSMSDATEKSALQRSKSEIGKLFSMFTSDTVKNLSHFYGNLMKYKLHKARADAGDATYSDMLKQDKAELMRSARTLAITGIMLGLIAQAFKYLYAKEEEEPEDKAKDFAIDIVSSTLNIFPIVSDIVDKVFLDYDISMNVLDVANDTLESVGDGFDTAGKAISGEYVSTSKAAGVAVNIAKSGLSLFGIPISPVERTITGLMRRFAPSAIYGYDAMFSNPSYTADLKKAVESGDEALAEYVLDQLYKNEVSGIYTSDELEEVVRLYGLTDEDGKHYNVLPQKVGAEINGVKLKSAQRRRFMSIYSGASGEVTKLIDSPYYSALTDEQRAKAIKNIYSMYYDRAAAEVAGKEWSNAVAYSYLTDNYTALFAAQAYKSGLSEQKDASGKKITVGEQFVEYAKKMGLSESDYVVVTYANGIKNKTNKAAIIAYINSLSLSAEAKAQIAERLGFEIKDGVVVEKEE